MSITAIRTARRIGVDVYLNEPATLGVNFTAFDGRFDMICRSRDASPSTTSISIGDRQLHGDSACSGGRLDRLDRGGHDSSDRDWRRLHHGLTRGKPRHIQEVVDEPRSHQRVPLDDLQRLDGAGFVELTRRRACAPSR